MGPYLMGQSIRVTRVMNAVAAGTTDQNGSSVDMAADGGYRGVQFVAAFGTLTSTQVTSMKAQQSDDDSTWEDLEGSSVGPLADADSNKLLRLDIYRPTKRYVRPVIDRGTANAVIDGVLAVQYDGNTYPSSDGTTVSAADRLVSPAAGTA